MFEISSRSYRILVSSLIYLTAIASALTIATLRSRAGNSNTVEETPSVLTERRSSDKPFFTLYTNRTYSSNERARLWIDYNGVESLDFRVYQIKDPLKFFTQLSDPHQMGEQEEEEFQNSVQRSPSALERVRALKRWAYAGIKSYVRTQLQNASRKSFNHKFRAEEDPGRVPLNVADYARVPLLNPDQLVSRWREPLTPLENQYDRRMIPLGKRDRGVYLVEAVSGDLRAYTVVVVTDLTMVEKSASNGEFLVYAVDRKTGEPRPGAQVQFVKNRKVIARAVTDNQGVFKTRIDPELFNSGEMDIDPATEGAGSRSFLILANDRDNFAISDLQSFYFGFAGDEDRTNLKSYIYTDRPVYRPNHKVYFKGILRAIDERGNYQSINKSTVNVTIEDPNNALIFTKELPLSSRGTFNGEMDLSEECPLGNYQITAALENGSSSTGGFEVAEYKKPEFKVKVSSPKAFVPAGDTTKFSIDARYFFGSPVTNAEVKYYIYRSRHYVWWIGRESDDDLGEEGESDDEYSDHYGYGDDMVQEGEGKLDASGKLDVEFQLPPIDENDPWDYSYRLDAQVTDSSRRTINGGASLVGTRGNIVAHASPDRYVYQKGDIAKIAINTTDYEGRPVSTRLQLKFMERTWTKVVKRSESGYSYDDYEVHEREVSSTEIETDSQGTATYNYPTSPMGNISIRTIINEGGKQVTSMAGFLWVAGYGQAWTESNYYASNYGSIKLVPDKKSYRPGETARVLAILPTDKAHLLVSTELSTVLTAWQVNAPDRSIILDVPIQASYAPNVFLNVTYVRDGEMYTSKESLVVPARDKALKLEIISNKPEYKPRETASYTILARDANGAPVSGAEVSLGVVDESIYSISPDFSGNIRREFYGMRYTNVETRLAINYTFVGYAGDKPMELAKNKPAYQLADFKNEGDVVEPIIRKNFKDTAFWQPEVITGADGRATVKVRLPDNLTTWRATAHGVTADTKVGETRYKVLARKDVILRLETPRFVTQGDTVTLSGIVHNYLKTDKATQISIAVEGAQLLSPSRQTVTIGKQGEHRVDWQVSTPNVGQIKLLAKALTDTESDAVELPLEVVPRGLRQVKNETWSTGEENADRTFTLEAPTNADARARKIRIEVAPSVAGTLFGALDYLTTYPYGCTEQTMSSFLPNVVVTQALKEVRSSSIRDSNDLEKKVRRGRDRLYAFQHQDGGWGWWTNDQSDPFMTAYVIDGLTLAKRAGYEIDENRIEQGRVKLGQMLASGTTEAGTSIDLETRAFMIYALEETASGVENQYVDGLFLTRDKLQPYGRALLALTLKHRKDDDRARQVANEIERSAADDGKSAHWESRRKEMLDFAEWNDTEATSLSLKALTRIKPDSAILPRAARWLVSNRRNGFYWTSTKDTAFAIFGLIDYLKVSRELSPDYNIEVYLNGETVLARHVSSASASQTFLLSRKASEVLTSNQVRIVKRGRGMLYFSVSLDYHTDEEQVAARGSSNLNLTREYLRLRIEEDGYKLKWVVEPLTGEIRSGDLLVVKLHVNGAMARHLMIEDPIPAGAEQLENVGNINLDYTSQRWSDWYSSREFRDNRTVYFLDYFDGDAVFQYAIRVQIPGEFRIAPARVELMYQPDTQANTNSEWMAFRERK